MNLNNRTRNIFLVIGAIFILFLLWYFLSIVTYVLIASVLSLVGRPIVKFLQKVRIKNVHLSKGISAFITLVILWIGFFGFFSFIIPLLVGELEQFSTIDFEAFFTTIEEPIKRVLMFTGSGNEIMMDNQHLMDMVKERLGAHLDFSQLSNVFGFIAGVLGEFFIAFFSVSFITYFFLSDETMFTESILLIIPTEYEHKVAKILKSIHSLLRRYFIGLTFEVLVVMTLVSLGLTIVGIGFNHAVVIGLFCGLFNVIPYLGPWMGAIVGLLIGVAINLHLDFMTETMPILGFMLLVFILVQIVDNILLQPLIYSSSVKAHPLEIFLVILAAGSLGGVLGMILAIPAYTILRVIAREFLNNLKLVRRITKNLE